jgi:truncated hemoglobin YjbI
MKSAFSGGKFKYTERSMDVAHARLFEMGLGGKEFDLVAGHLVKALNELNVPQDIITDVIEVVGPLRPIFVSGYEKYANKEK